MIAVIVIPKVWKWPEEEGVSEANITTAGVLVKTRGKVMVTFSSSPPTGSVWTIRPIVRWTLREHQHRGDEVRDNSLDVRQEVQVGHQSQWGGTFLLWGDSKLVYSNLQFARESLKIENSQSENLRKWEDCNLVQIGGTARGQQYFGWSGSSRAGWQLHAARHDGGDWMVWQQTKLSTERSSPKYPHDVGGVTLQNSSSLRSPLRGCKTSVRCQPSRWHQLWKFIIATESTAKTICMRKKTITKSPISTTSPTWRRTSSSR